MILPIPLPHPYLNLFIWLDLQPKQIPSHILYLSIQIPTGTNTQIPSIRNTQTFMSLHTYLHIHYNIMTPLNLFMMMTLILNPKPYKSYCIHHQTTILGHLAFLQQLSTYVINQDILIQVAPSTPSNTKIHYNKIWHALPNPPSQIYFTNIALPLPTYTFALPLKYPLEYSYYMDGSFFPPKQLSPNNWRPKVASYGVFSSIKNLQISKRLPSLQNILRAELMAIYTTIKLNIR